MQQSQIVIFCYYLIGEISQSSSETITYLHIIYMTMIQQAEPGEKIPGRHLNPYYIPTDAITNVLDFPAFDTNRIINL